MNLLVVFELEKNNSKVRSVRLKTMHLSLSSDSTTFDENVQSLEATINEAMVELLDDGGGVKKVKIRQIIPIA